MIWSSLEGGVHDLNPFIKLIGEYFSHSGLYAYIIGIIQVYGC